MHLVVIVEIAWKTIRFRVTLESIYWEYNVRLRFHSKTTLEYILTNSGYVMCSHLPVAWHRSFVCLFVCFWSGQSGERGQVLCWASQWPPVCPSLLGDLHTLRWPQNIPVHPKISQCSQKYPHISNQKSSGPSGAWLLDGFPSGLLTLSFAPFARWSPIVWPTTSILQESGNLSAFEKSSWTYLRNTVRGEVTQIFQEELWIIVGERLNKQENKTKQNWFGANTHPP